VRSGGPRKRSLAPFLLAVCVWLVWPAESIAKALVRFVHGVPGVGRATVRLDDGTRGQDVGTIGFGQSARWHSIRSGRFRWTLQGGGRQLAAGSATVGDGAYDIVVLERRMKVWLGIYKASAGKPGTSLVRVIHGAPELGAPELMVDGKNAVRSLGYGQATPYVPLPAGTHTLGAMRPAPAQRSCRRTSRRRPAPLIRRSCSAPGESGSGWSRWWTGGRR
jgi:hypothetical protein